MGDTTINIGTINVSSAEALPEALREVARGASPEFVRETGDPVDDGAESVVNTPSEQLTLQEEQEKAEALAVSQDQIDANARSNYLTKLAGEVSDQRRAEGFSVNHQRNPNYRPAVEAKNTLKQAEAKESLSRACGVCALAKTCPIKDDLGAWVATHPYADSDKPARYTAAMNPKVKRFEGRNKFLRRLAKDPLADCVPPEAKKQSKAA